MRAGEYPRNPTDSHQLVPLDKGARLTVSRIGSGRKIGPEREQLTTVAKIPTGELADHEWMHDNVPILEGSARARPANEGGRSRPTCRPESSAARAPSRNSLETRLAAAEPGETSCALSCDQRAESFMEESRALLQARNPPRLGEQGFVKVDDRHAGRRKSAA